MKKKKGALLLSVFFCGSGQFFVYKQRMKGAALFFIPDIDSDYRINERILVGICPRIDT